MGPGATAAAACVLGVSVMAAGAHAAQSHLDTIKEQCGLKLRMPATACGCIAGKAAALSDHQQAFVAATLTKNKAEAEKLRAAMSLDDQVQAGTFMTSAPGQCAGQ